MAAPLLAAPPLAAALPAVVPNELAVTADSHWAVQVLGIAALNVGGFMLVQQGLRNAMDNTPVTLVRLRCALRETQHGGGLRKRLGEMRGLADAGSEGLWLALEETVNEINRRSGSVAYADTAAAQFKSQREALSAFKRVASDEAALAGAEEAAHVSPEPPEECGVDWERSGSPNPFASVLGSFFGGPPVDTSCQEMVVVTLVVAARGVLDVPPVSNWKTLRQSLQQVCGVSRSSLMAIELLWSPDNADDYLTAANVIQDYPSLIDLASGRPVGGSVMASADGEGEGEGAARAPAGTAR
ncbi:MAG: hypothetical protein J3K34DRAFT_518215 [Monoraphidium minutum]|nr:MAG: hypothetical protein J3K34DRAFT_518215 [Monoraphidium minutum]